MTDEIEDKNPMILVIGGEGYSDGLMTALMRAQETGTGMVIVYIKDDQIKVEPVDNFRELEERIVIMTGDFTDRSHSTNEISTRARQSNKSLAIAAAIASMPALEFRVPNWSIANFIEDFAYEVDQRVHHDPTPKKIPFKQAPRQSIRQSMRSVNRNR